MWVAKFTLRDDEDIYSPLCVEHGVQFHAMPYTNYEKDGGIHVILGGIISGTEQQKDAFLEGVRADGRVRSIDRSKDFVLIHVVHPLSREARAEISRFYDPQYILRKPVRVDTAGIEHWEVCCVDRDELNRLVQAARKHYHGKLQSLQEETITSISSLALSPALSEKQTQAVQLALQQGYYGYPRETTLQELAEKSGVAFSTFQEHLSKAEAKIIHFMFSYR